MAEYPVKVDVRRLVRDLGGPSSVFRLLISYDVKITEGTVRKWVERESMPLDAYATLLYIKGYRSPHIRREK